MTLTTPIEIDLLTFFKTGKFDYLKVGQTKEWIINNFPDPDEVYTNSYDSPIWFYGDIELHFNDTNELFLIFSDHIDTLQGGNSLRLNKWILDEPEKLTLEYVVHYLNQERINYKVMHGTLSSGYSSASIVMVPSGVSLNFSLTEKDDEDYEAYLHRSKTENANTFLMHSFSLTNN
jgi:hypothetical protein